MVERRRADIKHVRDRAKAKYPAKTPCVICGSSEGLDLHHYSGLTELWERWCKKNGHKPVTDEDVIALRDTFIAEHQDELYTQVVSLCHIHHELLHKLYGKRPLPTTAKAQALWVEKQKAKFELKRNSKQLADETQSSSGADS